MRPLRHRFAAFSAAAVVAAVAVAGCSDSLRGAPSSPASAVLTGGFAREDTPAPPPEALTDVLYRLADPGVPGTEKLNLVEGATSDNAITLERFATALRDGGYAPVTFGARDIAWSGRNPADVVVTVDVGTPNPDTVGFSFPMEFKPYQGGWQLSRQTADMLLAFGSSQVRPSTTSTP